MEGRLCELARSAPSLAEWRRGALGVVGELVAYDAALFHELSPRVPLDRGGFVGIDPALVAGTLPTWDENAIALGRIRDVALAQGGVATDDEAFSTSKKGRREWERRVRRPLGLASVMLAHLVVRSRIVSVAMLARTRGPRFTSKDRAAVAKLVPALSVCDGLLQGLEGRAEGAPRESLACVDQRLTERQREVVVQVALGHTDRDIGEALGISPNTVRNLLVQVRARLGAANRAEIVRMAVLR